MCRDGPRPGLQSPRDSDVHSTPSSALRNSQESKRKVDVNHEGHMEVSSHPDNFASSAQCAACGGVSSAWENA